MKKKIICMVIIFCLMLFIPFLTIENKDNFAVKENSLSKETLYQIMYNEFKPEYHTETLKVLSIILQTNYSKKTKLKTISKDEFYNRFNKEADEYYKKIKDAINETYEKIILHNESKPTITYSYVSKNFDVATPWDSLKAEYKNATTKDISLNTVNHLCKMGYSYNEALTYFLGKIKIDTTP